MRRPWLLGLLFAAVPLAPGWLASQRPVMARSQQLCHEPPFRAAVATSIRKRLIHTHPGSLRTARKSCSGQFFHAACTPMLAKSATGQPQLSTVMSSLAKMAPGQRLPPPLTSRNGGW